MKINFRGYKITAKNIWRIYVPFLFGLFVIIVSLETEGYPSHILFALGCVSLLVLVYNIRRKQIDERNKQRRNRKKTSNYKISSEK